ncbi:TPR repeat-containing protein [Geobacter metallireducens RCH3]|uniref:TPR domain protein n=1 Tax=Geobacter metallireducens (strain ATCC 53774 / DSM 7210 / GS-15) TaxID=269799 RepID=Q39Y47_GEOMG|nr:MULTISPECIES: tetratricopeptide repeat protein [Geobacter]ABB30827.1 TPR domain protein [Geobacter metallireducens GS-15]EHP88240.1 TPR repeat-containing protein [Geobacter metallireducens RCH3]MBT1075398.1 hypothetical protein [Geobacter grbiciae]
MPFFLGEPKKYAKHAAGIAAAWAALICLAVYLRALGCDFINFDDPYYVIDNPGIRILDRQFIREAFTTSYLGWWMPLTWASFAIDYHFWGLDPLGYHLTNIVLHALNAGLVVLVADRLLRRWQGEWSGGGTSFLYPAVLLLAGLLWGIHPLRVESVAWVTERKDVLNGVFALGSIFSYLCYADREDNGRKGARSAYAVSLLFFLLSLMAKPVSVVIPAMLLVLDWYPLGRLSRENAVKRVAEKLPFFALALAVVAATITLASGESILVSFHVFPLYKRIILAGSSLFAYLRMAVFPVGLVNLYLLPRVFPASYYLAALGILALTCFCFFGWKRRPGLLAAWLLFVLPLAPVLGFLQNGSQAYADRFTYLPGVALSIGGAGLLGGMVSRCRGRSRQLVVALAVAATILCGTVSYHLIGAWKNPETLWSRVIAVEPIGRAFYLRADYRQQKGRYLEAAADLADSIAIGERDGFPGVFNLHAMRGDALNRAGRYGDAVREFTTAINLKPVPEYFYHRGTALMALGRGEEAAADFREAGDATGPIAWEVY